MKPPQFIPVVLLSLVTVILPFIIWSHLTNLIALNEKNMDLQNQMQAQQQEINKGSMAQQVGTNMLRDIGQASLKDDKLKDVLTKSGFSVNVAPAPGSSPAAKSGTTP